MVVDDNRSIRTTLELVLAPHFQQVVVLASPNLLPTTLREHPETDVVLLDMNFSSGLNDGNEGLYWLKEIKKLRPDVGVVLFTAYADIDLAVRAIKEGASDFVQKPWDNTQLVATLKNAMRLGRSEKKVRRLQASRPDAPTMEWGHSAAMMRLCETIEKVAPTEANILITGENGTGKDLLATEIHRLSPRSEELLVAVDMGAITETLFESELFGHVKGAFTDARTDRIGKFEAAEGGTLFLDEVANLPAHLQAKLLVALQSRTITRVGSSSATPIDIRLISATNRNPDQLVARGEFRQDLLYRLNTITIELPPLRERREDIVPLALLFLRRYAAKYGKAVEAIAPSAQNALTQAFWPGNIRELQHTIERAVILGSNKELSLADLSMRKADTEPSNDQTIEAIERTAILSAMEQCGNNLSAAATRLGITRQTLYNKLKRYER